MQSLSIAFIFLFAILANWTQTPSKKLTITPLTGDLYVFTSYGMYNDQPVPANGMYLVTKDGAVLFDAPWDTTQFQPLLDSIKRKHGQNVVLCLATHWHDDRSAGLTFYAKHGAKTYTSKLTDQLCKEYHKPRPNYTFNQDTVFTVGEYSFEAYYPGEGHTKDNIVVWLEKDKVLYGGCLIKSTAATNLGNVDDGNVRAWPQSIRNIQQRFGLPQYIVTGHDRWDSKASLDYTLKLLAEQGAN
ncbi:BcII family subclass B1 metallo-beta-lactamase [Olivibacter ginsenosidimutans]|uniref:beta-lactamase n=1 Tax=Olivibacter ginsenosidimutans TaxID=1176537 RepID=A0ABP9CB22_9SPHI